MEEQILTALSGLGVVFNMTEKRAVADFFEVAAILPHVSVMKSIGQYLGRPFEQNPPFAVIGIGEDAVSGSVIAQWTAHHISQTSNTEVLAVRACRKDVGLGITINGVPPGGLRGKRVLVVTDVLATGATVRLLVEKLRGDIGSHVIGIAAIGEREDVETRLPHRTTSHTLFGIKRREPVVRKPSEKRRRV